VQLKKVDKHEEAKDTDKITEPYKSAFVVEQSSGVSQLKYMFDPTARQKALEKSLSKVEEELQKGSDEAREHLAHA
jgi:hypothetical protein